MKPSAKLLPQSDTNYLMADGITKPKDRFQETCSIGGRTDSKPEAKKAKKYHSNPENEDGFNSKWEVGGARPEALAPAAAGTGANRHGAHGTAHGAAAKARPCRGLPRGTWS